LTYNPDDPWGAELQVGEIVSQGVELQGKMYLTESWDVTASYTFIDMEITEGTDDLEGTTPIYVPKNSANIWSNYNFNRGSLDGTPLSAGVRYVGEMQMDGANSEMVPEYTVVDLSIGYDLGAANPSLEGASVNLIANNLFDKKYYSCFDTANC
jgi:iron complex outermembrane receptor protein